MLPIYVYPNLQSNKILRISYKSKSNLYPKYIYVRIPFSLYTYNYTYESVPISPDIRISYAWIYLRCLFIRLFICFSYRHEYEFTYIRIPSSFAPDAEYSIFAGISYVVHLYVLLRISPFASCPDCLCWEERRISLSRIKKQFPFFSFFKVPAEVHTYVYT